MRDIQALIDAGYHQVSSAHCIIARLPEGKTGRQALAEQWRDDVLTAGGDATYAQEEWRRARKFSEADATDHYLRVHATDKLTLTAQEFRQFRQLGGRPAR